MNLGLLLGTALVSASALAGASECPDVPQLTGKRHLVAISDLHFGLGKVSGKWLPSEDFRWPQAFARFLQRISTCSKNKADLVIAGDALELWQPPADIACKGANADTSCTRTEWIALTRKVINAHQTELKALGAFAAQGSNRVYFVPGNHDAALHIDAVWQLLADAIGASAQRVLRCGKLKQTPCAGEGVWLSEDGTILVEHGHQGEELNKFRHWPPTPTTIDKVEYLERPWGQYFVQSLFNNEETDYRIIDNIVPETAGAKLRIADRGLWKSVKDVARLLKFNLVTTSGRQKKALLSGPEPDAKTIKWEVPVARAQGHHLFLDALALDDPFRVVLSADDAQSLALRTELTATLLDPARMTDDEVIALCDRIAPNAELAHPCKQTVLGGLHQRLIEGDAMLGNYLGPVLKQKPFVNVQVYIYGHTHDAKEGFDVATDARTVRAFNTGAFQRLIDGRGLQRRATERNISAREAMKTFENESLPPCYTAVIAALDSVPLQVRTLRWHMEENGPGEFVTAADQRCD